jgi:flagellar biosynthesis protein FlhA
VHLHDGRLPVLTLDPVLEHGLVDAIRPTEAGPVVATDPDTTERLMTCVAHAVQTIENTGVRPVLLCSGGLRAPLRRLLRSVEPDLAVLAYSELDRTIAVDALGVIDLSPIDPTPVALPAATR